MSNKFTFEIAKEKIEKKYSNLKLITFIDRHTLATFIDLDFEPNGKFEGIYKWVLYGQKQHPERSKINRSLAAKRNIEKVKKTNLEKYGVENPFQSEKFKQKARETRLKKYGVEYVSQSKEFKEKIKQTNLNNHGVDNPAKLDKFKQKAKDTCLNKYGVEHASQSDFFKNKVKQSNLDKYGHEYATQHSDIKEKIKQNNIKKYGVASVSQVDEFKEKAKETNLKKYGTEYASQSPIVIEKTKQTCLERYGFTTNLQSNETIEKAKKTNLKKYGTEYASQSNIFKEQVRKTNIFSGFIKIYDGKTIKEIAEEKNYAYNTVQAFLKNGGDLDLLNNKDDFGSLLELKMSKILNDIKLNYIIGHKENFTLKHNKKKYKPDFIFENQKLIIEADGLAVHSDLYQKNNFYHKNKQYAYKYNGYDSLFFRSDEINNKSNIIKSIILNKLFLIKNKIFARKCYFQEIKDPQSEIFFDANHLNGNSLGKCYGLIYDNKLVCAIKFVINNNNDMIISRFCSKINYIIPGGLNKLLNNIIKIYNPNKIISYIDLKFGNGESFKNIGFKETNVKLNFKWTNGCDTFHKSKFKYDSGYENDLYKIWDCGQLKLEMIIN